MSSTSKEVGKFFRHSTIYAVGNALNRLGAFVLLPIYTRLLAPAEYGALETLYLVSTVISGILGIGIAHATLRFYFDYKEPADQRSVVSTNLIASLVISAAGVLLVSYFSGWITSALFHGVRLGNAFQWMLVTIVFELASQVALAYVRAVERSVFFIVISLAKLLIQVAANTIALVYFNAGVEGVMAGNCLTVALGFVLLAAFTLRECGLRFEWSKLMPVLRYSFPLLLSAMVGIASVTADRFLLQSLVSLEALGIYALALKFSKLISDLVGEPVNRAYGAYRFTIMARADAGVIQADVVRYLAVLLTVMGLLVVLFAPDVLRLMAAPSYWPAASYLPWLVLAAILQVLVYPLQTGIYYQKQSRQIFYVSLVQGIVGVGLGALMIWRWGTLGACLSVLATALVTALMTDRISQRYFVVRYQHAKLLILLALAVGVTAGGYAADLLVAPWGLAAKIVLLVAFFFALALTRVITPDETQIGKAWLLRRLAPTREVTE